MKIFLASVATETNTFSPMPTGLQDFDIIRPADYTADRAAEVGDLEIFRQLAAAGGHDFVFSLAAGAQPAGLTVRHVYEGLRDEFLAHLQRELPVDIVLLPLHGAMVADGYDDCEGDMITRVRQIVGPATVIGVDLDLHCHLTQQMVDQADLIVIYKEYPHVDVGLRAKELFQLAVDTKAGKIKPTMALFDCHMIGFYYTPYEPMRSFVDAMMAAEGQHGVLSLSLAHCFPWGNVPDCGARMLAITNNNQTQAQHVATEWGRRFYNMRHTVTAASLPMHEALDRALASSEAPIVVADQADNAGGGAPSDSTFVLRELLQRGVTNAGLAMIWDPIVVNLAKAAGVGATLTVTAIKLRGELSFPHLHEGRLCAGRNPYARAVDPCLRRGNNPHTILNLMAVTLTVRLGGKMGPMSGDPLDLTVTVMGIIEKMVQNWPQLDGDPLLMPCGDAVALHCQGIDIIVNSKRGQVFSPAVFSNLGIDPAQKKLLVVKSTQHFYAGYAPIAAQILYMAAPGAIAPIMTEIPYTRVDLNKYPWVDDPLGAQ